MKQLLVNADDMGATSDINAGILQAHLHGIVTAASIMAGGKAYQEAIAIALAHPSLDCGIHLTLSDGNPILSHQQVDSLLANDGRFHADPFTFIRHYIQGEINLEQVEHELAAQISVLQDDGIMPSHIDSHQHLHMLPAIHRIVRRLARRHNISWIRTPSELTVYPWRRRGSHVDGLRMIQQGVLWGLCQLLPTRASRRCNRFVGFYCGGRLSLSALQSIIHHLPADSVTELMCHPGTESSHEQGGGIYHRDSELNVLTSPKIKSLLHRQQVALIPFEQRA